MLDSLSAGFSVDKIINLTRDVYHISHDFKGKIKWYMYVCEYKLGYSLIDHPNS